MKRIIGLSIISILLTVLDLNGNLCSADSIRITHGGYNFTVSRESEQFEKHKINDSELPCLSYNKEITISKVEQVIFSDLESITQEIETAFGVNLSSGSSAAMLNAKIELKNILLKKKQVEITNEYNAQIKCSMVLNSLKCFNQEVLIVYKVSKYDVKGLKKRSLFKDKEINFSFTDKVFSHLLKRYTYNETCCRDCEIPNKSEPVLGLDGEQIFVMIKYENKEIYIFPLYWGSERKIISPFVLLPENVQNYSASLFSRTKESIIFRTQAQHDSRQPIFLSTLQKIK